MIQRGETVIVLPDDEVILQRGDRLLLCGNGAAFSRLHWNLCQRSALEYVRDGEVAPQGWLWRRFKS